MTDEDEFAARSQLKWTREDDAWILLYRRPARLRAHPRGGGAQRRPVIAAA